jgi:hypothetical protein
VLSKARRDDFVADLQKKKKKKKPYTTVQQLAAGEKQLRVCYWKTFFDCHRVPIDTALLILVVS